MQKHYQNEANFKYVSSRNNLPKLKDGAYVINLDEYESIRTHWTALHPNGNSTRASNDAIYFDSFEVEHILKEMEKLIGNKNIITKIFIEHKHTIR